ncbi:MAG: response regulator [Elusimicrobiota bacterium]
MKGTLDAGVLVVDDEPAIRRLLTRWLELKGCSAAAAATAEEALEMTRARPYDVILLDEGLPGMMGLPALMELSRQTSAAIIMMTGRPSDDLERDALLLGARAFVRKPLDLDALERTIRESLRGKEGAAPSAGGS